MLQGAATLTPRPRKGPHSLRGRAGEQGHSCACSCTQDTDGAQGAVTDNRTSEQAVPWVRDVGHRRA